MLRYGRIWPAPPLHLPRCPKRVLQPAALGQRLHPGTCSRIITSPKAAILGIAVHQRFHRAEQCTDILDVRVPGLGINDGGIDMRDDLRHACLKGNLQNRCEVIQIDAARRLKGKSGFSAGLGYRTILFFQLQPLHRIIFERIAAHVPDQSNGSMNWNDGLRSIPELTGPVDILT